jgi:hypothetical protein
VRRGRGLEREASSRLERCACRPTNQGWHGDGVGARARTWRQRLKPLGNCPAPARRTSASSLYAPVAGPPWARWATDAARWAPRREVSGRAQARSRSWAADAETDEGHVWFITSIATLCLTFLPKVSYSILTTNLRQSVAHLGTNQTYPKAGARDASTLGRRG